VRARNNIALIICSRGIRAGAPRRPGGSCPRGLQRSRDPDDVRDGNCSQQLLLRRQDAVGRAPLVPAAEAGGGIRTEVALTPRAAVLVGRRWVSVPMSSSTDRAYPKPQAPPGSGDLPAPSPCAGSSGECWAPLNTEQMNCSSRPSAR
jgi:hypothetical protein